MKVGDSVRMALLDWDQGEVESAMMHACNAVNGTAKQAYPTLGDAAAFTRLLRASYSVLGPMGAPGVDLVNTRFPVVVKNPKAPGGKPDLADVVYGVHRCSHGHGDELPEGFELIPNAAGPVRCTQMEVRHGKVRLSDRIIFGLLAVAVISPINATQSIPTGFWLKFSNQPALEINEWWGRAEDFAALIALEPLPLLTLNFSSPENN